MRAGTAGGEGLQEGVGATEGEPEPEASADRSGEDGELDDADLAREAAPRAERQDGREKAR